MTAKWETNDKITGLIKSVINLLNKYSKEILADWISGIESVLFFNCHVIWLINNQEYQLFIVVWMSTKYFKQLSNVTTQLLLPSSHLACIYKLLLGYLVHCNVTTPFKIRYRAFANHTSVNIIMQYTQLTMFTYLKNARRIRHVL